MRADLRIILITGVLIALVSPAAAIDVYVSNPAEGRIYSLQSDGGPDQIPAVLFEERRFAVEDLVIGPDDLLYACAPDEGVVFRFDPTAVPVEGLSLDDVEILDTTGIVAPQCGWFSDRGDLFLTDRLNDTAVWIYRDLVPVSSDAPPAVLAPLVAASGAFAGFSGQGVTQAAPGDLLFVDQAGGQVGVLHFDPIFRFDAPTSAGPMVAFGGLTDPVGVARSSSDTVFVASGSQLASFGPDACSPSSFNGQTPQFLQFVSEDVLLVTSTSKKVATVWWVDAAGCGTPQAIFTFERPDYVPSLSGVAVPRSDRTAASSDSSKSDADYVFNFRDHAYELTITPDGECVPNPVVATETLAECLVPLISPDFIVLDQNDEFDNVTGVPVPYAGDGGFAQVYSLTSDNCGPSETREIRHAVSAYTRLIGNPRMVRCVIPDGVDLCDLTPADFCPPGATGCEPTYCELTELESYFPFNGIFPDDGRTGTTTREFSEYFLADITLSGTGDTDRNAPGCFCGWEDPLPNIPTLDPDDPFFGLPEYNSGSSVPLKFRVAALPPDETCDTLDVCDGSPYGYVTGAEILLSVAKIFDADGVEDFTPLAPTATSATTPGSIFGNPSSPSTPYHYNLDTSGYEPGVYQAVAVALTDNFAVEWTYFAIK